MPFHNVVFLVEFIRMEHCWCDFKVLCRGISYKSMNDVAGLTVHFGYVSFVLRT